MNKEDTEQCVIALRTLRQALCPSSERSYLEIENALLACPEFMDVVPMCLLNEILDLKGTPHPAFSVAKR
jgi:hypothetical protein